MKFFFFTKVLLHCGAVLIHTHTHAHRLSNTQKAIGDDLGVSFSVFVMKNAILNIREIGLDMLFHIPKTHFFHICKIVTPLLSKHFVFLCLSLYKNVTALHVQLTYILQINM